MSDVPKQVNVPLVWEVARAELQRVLSRHAAAVNERLLGADVGSTGSATATFSATNKPGANNKTSPDTWVQINLNGTLYYVPAFLP